MTTDNDVHSTEEWGGRLTPSDVHHVLFTRAGLGRRGYDEVEVDVFLERVQQELTRLIGEKTDLRDEVTRLKAQLVSAGSGSRAATAVDSITREEAQLQAVRLLAAAQQTADTYVADAEKYSQRLTVDAREHSEQMVAEAREAAQRMVAEAERLAGDAAAQAVDGQVGHVTGPTREELDQQVAYLKTFGQVVRVQLRAYLEALLRDVEEEWGRADPGVLLATPSETAPEVPTAAADGQAPGGAPAPAGHTRSGATPLAEPAETPAAAGPGDPLEPPAGPGEAAVNGNHARPRPTAALHSG